MLLASGHALVARWPDRSRWSSGNRRWPVEGTEQPHHDDYVYDLRDEESYLHADDDKTQIREPFDRPPIVCQFCGKSSEQVAGLFGAKRLVRDPNTSALAEVWICNECVARMAQILAEEPPSPHRLRRWRNGHPAASCDRRIGPGPQRGHIRATNDQTATDNTGHQRFGILTAHRPESAIRRRSPPPPGALSHRGSQRPTGADTRTQAIRVGADSASAQAGCTGPAQV